MAHTGTDSMADKQPPALRLAEELKMVAKHSGSEYWDTIEEASAELIRLYELSQELLSELYVYRASEYLRDVTAALKARRTHD